MEYKVEKKMDSELKARWVTALTSGEYEQAKDKLYAGTSESGIHKMCCLGVLEHICGTSLDDFLDMEDDGEYPESIKYPQCPLEIIQQPIYELGPIEERKGQVGYFLARMNDTGKSFEEIAQFIEKYL